MNESQLDSLIEKYTSELIDMGTRFNHPFSKAEKSDKDDKNISAEENLTQEDVQEVSEEEEEQEEKEEEEQKEYYEENMYSREPFSSEITVSEQEKAAPLTPEREVPAENPEDFALFRASVFTADSAYPVENARVIVKKNGEIHAFLFTNGSGETKQVKLESYPEENSLNPDSNQQYMRYTADIHADGFDSLLSLPVEAVGGSQILLRQNLIPTGGSV